MDNIKAPFRGIAEDYRGRASCYKQDWVAGIRSGIGILAPTTYMFFASALPVIAFGEQLSRDTDGSLSTVETLASTAICGIMHSILGGQPLLILGVAEPSIIMYTYLYKFAKDREDLGQKLFLAWAGWICFWTALFLFLLAIFNAGTLINRFTRIAGETFGMLIAVLFVQEAIKTLICGLIGLPPSNGVLPQSPMHTKSLGVLKGQLIRRKMIESAKESIKQNASNSEMYGKMQAVFIELDHSPVATVVKELENLKKAVIKEENEEDKEKETFDPEKHLDPYLPVRVNEQRVSNLLQSLLVASSVFAMPVIKKIPTSVLWGYFAYMAIDSLPGNQFWERILLLFITPGRRYKVLVQVHPSFVESVPFRYIVIFTLFQFVFFLVCFGVTWIPIAGILFPVPFFLLISIRQHLLPKLFPPHHLRELDTAEYEEIGGAPQRSLSLSLRETEAPYRASPEGRLEMSDAEILDELTTNRGEIKLRISFNEEERPQVKRTSGPLTCIKTWKFCTQLMSLYTLLDCIDGSVCTTLIALKLNTVQTTFCRFFQRIYDQNEGPGLPQRRL